jgi:hypothetical protein
MGDQLFIGNDGTVTTRAAKEARTIEPEGSGSLLVFMPPWPRTSIAPRPGLGAQRVDTRHHLLLCDVKCSYEACKDN